MSFYNEREIYGELKELMWKFNAAFSEGIIKFFRKSGRSDFLILNWELHNHRLENENQGWLTIDRSETPTIIIITQIGSPSSISLGNL